MNDQEVIKTRPPQVSDTLLQERFYDSVAGQAELMDKLAQTLLTVELAIPGLYAAVLKLISGKDSLTLSYLLVFAFCCWLLALICTLYAVFPKPYQVNTREIRNSANSIETFFNNSARYKWHRLLYSVGFFIAGLGAVLWDVFQ